MAHKPTARQRVVQRVRQEEKRLGLRPGTLVDRPAPKPVRRGKFPSPPKTSPIIQKTPSAVINVLTGAETREKVRRATGTKRKRRR